MVDDGDGGGVMSEDRTTPSTSMQLPRGSSSSLTTCECKGKGANEQTKEGKEAVWWTYDIEFYRLHGGQVDVFRFLCFGRAEGGDGDGLGTGTLDSLQAHGLITGCTVKLDELVS